VALSIGQLAKHLPSAAGFATYTSRGLHPRVGFLVAWGYALAEALVAPLLYLIFGNVVAGTLAAQYGWSFDTWWPIATVVSAVLVLAFGWFGIRLSTGAGTVLGLFEIVVFAALAIWMIIEAGNRNTLSVFTTEHATVDGFTGFNGVIAGSVFAILAFIGFEAAAPLAEEAKNPTRTIRVAVVASALLIGLFYVLTTYAATVFFGPERFAEFPGFGDGNPWQQLGRDVWGIGWVLVFLAVIISAVANSNAGANATTRTWFALGRNRILPGGLARTHARWQSPYVAVVGQFVLALAVALPLGYIYDPVTAFSLVATMVTAVIILIYIALNLACVGFYLRERRSEFNVVRHLIVPVLGVLAFIPAIMAALGIGEGVLPFITALPYPLNLAGPVVAGWLGLGLLYLLYLTFTGRGDKVSALNQLYVGDEPGMPSPRPPGDSAAPAATPAQTDA